MRDPGKPGPSPSDMPAIATIGQHHMQQVGGKRTSLGRRGGVDVVLGGHARLMQGAVLPFEGFNELESFVAAAIINRLRPHGLAAHITAPTETVASMNGVSAHRQHPLDVVEEADAVLIGSGISTCKTAADAALLARLRLDPARQRIAAQRSGTLLLAKRGLIGSLPASTDLTTKPWVVEGGVAAIDAPFAADDNVATGGGGSSRGKAGPSWRAKHFITLRGSARRSASSTML